MSAFYTSEIKEKTTAFIQQRFHVSPNYANCLAVAALDGIASHGFDPEDWNTVVETVNVAVASWIKKQAID